MPCSAFHADQHPMTVESEEAGFLRKSKAQMTKEIRDLRIKVCNAEMSLRDAHERLRVQKVQSNRAFLDLRRRLQWQEELIRNLRRERDGLMNSLTSRLLLVEGELRKEQKHIETLLEEKDRIIEQQEQELRQLRSLQSYSTVSPSVTGQHSQRARIPSTAAMVSKRFSLALDEYIKDCTTVSRASPIFLDGEAVKPLNRVHPCVLNFEEPRSNEKCISQIPIIPGKDEVPRDSSRERKVAQRDSKDSISGIHDTSPNTIQPRSMNYFPLKKSNAASLPELHRKSYPEEVLCESEESHRPRLNSGSFLPGSNSVIKVPWYRPPDDQPPSKYERFSDISNTSSSSLSVIDSDSLGSSEQSDSLDSGISMQSFTKSYTNSEPPSPSSFHHANDSFSYSRNSTKCSYKSRPELPSTKPFSVTVTNSKYPCSLSTAVINPEHGESSNCDEPKNISRISLKTYVQHQLPVKRLSKSSSDASVNSPTYTSAVNESKGIEVAPTSKNKGKDLGGSCERLTAANHGVSSWVSGSANRSFGTNHRSVTKLRDIKFKKLSKFQNRLIGDPSTSIDVRGLVNEVVLTV